jgi:hypothetical protein
MKPTRLLAATCMACLSAAAPGGAIAQTTPTIPNIPGYALGQKSLAKAPYTLNDLEALKKTLLFSDEDIRYLRMSKAILADQT